MTSTTDRQRLRIAIRGAVQGVGFRPFIYRLATSLALDGWVLNSPQGVLLEVEGPRSRLDEFLLRVEPERPPQASIQSLESSFLDCAGYEGFAIRPSNDVGERSALILPDLATCPDCLADILDMANRRYRYPFTNCTNCGPRFSIIRSLPYDRPNTTMGAFAMCDACRAEYDDPLDRRFHAQPNACPRCGPQLALWDRQGTVLAREDAALAAAEEVVRQGEVLALKGLGGFHLLVDARSEAAVVLLRQRKRREEKPLAIMAPSLAWVREHCTVSPLEARLMSSAECPIVLVGRAGTGDVAKSVAPGNPTLGVMLPYTPLHHLLMRDLGFPVIATSGNLSDEPICTDEREAIERLHGIASAFLVHNRPIARHVDDSVARVLLGRELLLRRARGYAPLPITLAERDVAEPTPTVLAVGAHLKNVVALSVGRGVFISQHIGDLETSQAYEAFRRVIGDLEALYEAPPVLAASDLHPDYLATQYARQTGLPQVGVQHHYAHVLSCMAENELEPPVLGIAWDGTGYGPDGTVWGGEFLYIDSEGFRRAGHLRPFALPGGDKAVREPRRSALGLLHQMWGAALWDRTDLAPVKAFTSAEMRVLRTALARRVNCPLTSSAGRLFDAVASLTGLRQIVRHEGQAAMELEFAAGPERTSEWYNTDVERNGGGPLVVNWAPMAEAILADLRDGTPLSLIAARFHNSLAEAIVEVAAAVGCERVALSGGCFQNRLLTVQAIERLRAAGLRPYWHQRIPPNDGGIALGQAFAALRGPRQE